MTPLRRLIDPGGVLAERLERLRYSLETLRDRLHEALAQALGDSVSGIVRETVQRLLQASAPEAEEAYPDDSRAGHNRWYRENRGWYDDDQPEANGEPPEQIEPAAPAVGGGRLPLALLAGWQAMRWWLRREGTRTSRWLGLGVGVAAGFAAWVGGPLALAGLNLAGSAARMDSLLGALARWPGA